MSDNNPFVERELDWDDSIEKEGGDFLVLPGGDYDFLVKTYERGRHPGSDKLPPCNKATLVIEIEGKNGEGTITLDHNLFLHTKTEGFLCAFFTSIGQRQHGERVTMNWSAVPGSRGRCKLGVRTFKSRSGEDLSANEILKFYEPDPATNASGTTPGGYTAGKF